MQGDTNLFFTGPTSGQAITTGSVRSTGILDLAQGLMLVGSTYPVSNLTGGNFYQNTSLVFGEDLGPGALRLRFGFLLGAAFVGGTSLNVQIQGAVDNSGGVYPASIGSLVWNTFSETGPIPVANLAASAVNPNRSFFKLEWPDRMIATNMPRFISINYVPVGTFSQGSILAAGVFTSIPDFNIGQYVGGFTVAP